MHPCLQVQEILGSIFSHISAGNQPRTQSSVDEYMLRRPGSKFGLSTLLGLATTCRAFSSPALNALWSFQPSLFFLMKLLPLDAFGIVSGIDGSVLVSHTERIIPKLL